LGSKTVTFGPKSGSIAWIRPPGPTEKKQQRKNRGGILIGRMYSPGVVRGQFLNPSPIQPERAARRTSTKAQARSPAFTSIAFRSGAEQALFAGDVLHCPLEVYKPDWNTVFDAFPEEARESRMWALKFAADHEAMIF